MTKRILLFSSKPNSIWVQTVSKAAQALGRLLVLSEHKDEPPPDLSDCDLIIVDSTGSFQETAALIERLRGERPKTPIVVVTMSPTWQRARQAFRVGATDYVRKSLDAEKTLADIRGIIGK